MEFNTRGRCTVEPNYQQEGLRFCYPDNWTIVDEDFTAWPRTVSAQSPDTGIWMAHWYSNDSSPTDLVGETLRAFRQEYTDVESHVVSEQIEGIDIVGYDISFYCVDLIASATVRAMRIGSQTLLVLCQAEDREFERVEPVFRAITTSMLRSSTFDQVSDLGS